jgi:hypothetical protein
MMGVVRLIAKKELTASDVDEIGLAAAGALVPIARQRKLTIEDISAAKGPPRDFKEYLGQKVPELDKETSVTCPRCGFEIKGCKYVRKVNE